MALLTVTDFTDLPSEPISRWLALRDIVERRVDETFDFNNGPGTHELLEYVEVLSAAADELELGNLETISPGNIHEEFEYFRAKVAALAVRLSIRQGTKRQSDYVLLSQPVKARLKEEVRRLKGIVANSNLDAGKASRLNDLLDQLSDEIEHERLNYKQLMKTLALCAAGIGGTTAFLADAPDAIATITQVLGLQIEAEQEDAEAKQLAPKVSVPILPSPPKQIAPPRSHSEPDP